MTDHLDKQVQAFDELVEVQPFTENIGEFMWLQNITRDRHTPPTEQDVLRALDFIFWWIVRWEAFSQTIVLDRREQWLISQRKVRETLGVPASVDSVQIESQSKEGKWIVSLKLRNVPDKANYRHWHRRVAECLRNSFGGDEVNFWQVTTDGALRGEVAASVQPNTLVEGINSSLAQAEEDIRRIKSEAAKAEEEFARQQKDFVDAVSEGLPEWITHIEVVQKTVGAGLACKIHFEGIPAFKLREALLSQEAIDECMFVDTGLSIGPLPSPERLIELLSSITPLVEEYAANQKEQQHQLELETQRWLTQARQAIDHN